MKVAGAIAILGLALTSSHAAWGQQVAVKGIVHDQAGKPIAQADVVLEKMDGEAIAHATSGGDGAFVFAIDGLNATQYVLVARKPEYALSTTVIATGTATSVETELVMREQASVTIDIYAKRLDEARNNLSPQTGTSAYLLDATAIAALPQGPNTPFNQVLEQAPGVARDSFGQLHMRGEHANLQYRLNGVLLPESISGFGQVIDSRIVDRAQLLTGALPAQYGYRTAGVVDIQTRSGAIEPGGVFDLYGGSRDTFQPSVQYAGTQGPLQYFMTGNFRRDEIGVESPTPGVQPLHDHSDQGKAFAYLSYLLDSSKRVSLIAGNSVGQFQIPNTPNQTPSYTLNGVNVLDSGKLKESQREETQFATVALQGLTEDMDYQLAPYARYSKVHYKPDAIGDLEYNGIASDVLRTNFAVGLQGDGSLRITSSHTLRAGVSYQHEHAVTDNASQVFPLDGFGNPLTTPVTLIDNNTKNAALYGIYLQDEWKLTRGLTLNYGLRFDAVNAYVNETQLSPRLGLVYKVTEDTTLHAGYARYFTPPPLELIAPSSMALFNNTSAQAANSQNDPVKSERSHTFDAGISHQLSEELQLGLDTYYKRVHNMLDEGQFGQALVFTPFNYRQGRIYGVEGTASYTGEKLNAYLNLAASRAVGREIISGQFNFDPAELSYIAGHYVHLDHDQTYTASSGVSYKILQDTRVSLDSLFGSGLRKDFANTGHLPWYGQIDLGVTQHVGFGADPGVDVRFAIINALDTTYQLRTGTGIGVGASQYGPRRGFYVGLTREF